MKQNLPKKKRQRKPKWEPKEVIVDYHIVPDEEFEQTMRKLGQLIYEQIVDKNQKSVAVEASTEPKWASPKANSKEKTDRLLKAVGLEESNGRDHTSSSVYIGPYRTDTLHFIPETSFTLFESQKDRPRVQL